MVLVSNGPGSRAFERFRGYKTVSAGVATSSNSWQGTGRTTRRSLRDWSRPGRDSERRKKAKAARIAQRHGGGVGAPFEGSQGKRVAGRTASGSWHGMWKQARGFRLLLGHGHIVMVWGQECRDSRRFPFFSRDSGWAYAADSGHAAARRKTPMVALVVRRDGDAPADTGDGLLRLPRVAGTRRHLLFL